MELEIAYNSETVEATAENIKDAIRNLPNEGNNFLILSIEEQVYVQVSGSKKIGYLIEYREGGSDRHFEIDQEVSEENVIDAFLSFYNKDDKYKRDLVWRICSKQHANITVQTRLVSNTSFIVAFFMVVIFGYHTYSNLEDNSKILGLKDIYFSTLIFVFISIGFLEEFRNWQRVRLVRKAYAVMAVATTIFLGIMSLLSFFGQRDF